MIAVVVVVVGVVRVVVRFVFAFVVGHLLLNPTKSTAEGRRLA